MASRVPSVDDLWRWALEDAGPAAAEAVLVPVSTFGNPRSHGRFMPPGERTLDLPEPELRDVNAHAARPRVVLPVEDLRDDPAVLLALMRHHLEYARVLHEARGAYAFALAVAAALSTPYATAGKGSAVVYNAIPMMASANAAAGRLVARRMGLQFGRLDDPHFGSLFLVDVAPLPLDELAEELVVFAAIWPDAVDTEVESTGRPLASLLADVDEAAPRWWEAVLADDVFRAMALGAASFRPIPDEREAFADHPAKAWWLVHALIARATRYGRSLLVRRAVRAAEVASPT